MNFEELRNCCLEVKGAEESTTLIMYYELFQL